jgi:hypothetical protein
MAGGRRQELKCFSPYLPISLSPYLPIAVDVGVASARLRKPNRRKYARSLSGVRVTGLKREAPLVAPLLPVAVRFRTGCYYERVGRDILHELEHNRTTSRQ